MTGLRNSQRESVQRLEPVVPARGAQGFWTWNGLVADGSPFGRRPHPRTTLQPITAAESTASVQPELL